MIAALLGAVTSSAEIPFLVGVFLEKQRLFVRVGSEVSFLLVADRSARAEGDYEPPVP